MDKLIILAAALVLDLLLGEPPLFIHPVVWMGKFTYLWEKPGFNMRPAAQFVYGTLMTLVSIALFGGITWLVLAQLKSFNIVVYVIAAALLLKSAFSLKELRQAALRIKQLLDEKKPEEARSSLRSLVKRDAKDLPEPLVVSAAVESVAENACDSFVAPLLYFLLFGVPGAVAYRVINTLDAMIGYHGKYEYLGKFAARLDDIVNIIPARLTALLIVLAAFLLRRNGAAAWRVMVRDHSRTASPNAGWPMSAAAGALGVRLEKVGFYKLGDTGASPEPKTIAAAVRLIDLTAFIWVIICCGAIYLVTASQA